MPEIPAGFDWPKPGDANVASAGGYIQVTGVGKADPKLPSETQRRSVSRDAAILDARARLETYLSRVMLPGQTSVGERASADKSWRKKLDEALTAIDIAETKWDGDVAAVVLRTEKAQVLRTFDLSNEE